MIKTFADKRAKELYERGKSTRFPVDVWGRAVRKLEYLDLATSVADLKVPPSNRLHKLERDRAGQYSISVNDQWRVCFRFVDRDAEEPVRHGRSSRGEAGSGRCAAAGPEKPEVYSLEYIEDFSGPRTKKMPEHHSPQ